MDSKHTPGPWEPVFGETYHVLGPDKGRVAISMNLKGPHGMAGRRTADEVAANTRLIASAPELLAERNRLRADVEALRADAERYRFLRQDFRVGSADIDGKHAWVYGRNFSLRGPSLDAAIDAARAARGQG